jgi:hypothetical protein
MRSSSSFAWQSEACRLAGLVPADQLSEAEKAILKPMLHAMSLFLGSAAGFRTL